MEDIDAQLRSLYADNIELTLEQSALEENLRQMQEEFRQDLSNLYEERSQILELSRSRIASLNAELEARNRESEAALDLAYSQLERLNTEQEKAAAIEAQLGAFFYMVGGQIQNGSLADASVTLENMRAFLNTPAFNDLRSVQARREVYSRSIDVMEATLEEARRNQEALAAARSRTPEDAEKELEELLDRNILLEETVAGLNRTLSALSSEGSGATARLSELEASSAALSLQNSDLENRLSEYTETITGMELQNAQLSQTLAARDNVITALEIQRTDLEQEIANLRNQIDIIRQTLLDN